MERTATDEHRPVEVAGAHDTPDTRPEPSGTPLDALALYRRPADPRAEKVQGEQAQAQPDEAETAEKEPGHANAQYFQPEERHHAGLDYADPDSPHPATEIDTAEYALPPDLVEHGYPEPSYAGPPSGVSPPPSGVSPPPSGVSPPPSGVSPPPSGVSPPPSGVSPPPSGVSLDTLFQEGDWTHPRDAGRRLPRAALAVTGAALALIGLGGVVVNAALNAATGLTPLATIAGERGPAKPTGARAVEARAVEAQATVVTGARDGRTNATFDFLSNATTVDMRVDDLGDQLFRITTPADGTTRPEAVIEGDDVRLVLTSTGPDSGPVAVGVVLNAKVRWTLRIAGGLGAGTLDMRGGMVGAVDLTGGAGRLDLSLPRPDGTLNVRMSGGVNLFRLAALDEVPVRVTARSGAGQVILDGTANNGVARGASFRSPGWADETDRIDLDAVAGFGTLRVSHDEAR